MAMFIFRHLGAKLRDVSGAPSFMPLQAKIIAYRCGVRTENGLRAVDILWEGVSTSSQIAEATLEEVAAFMADPATFRYGPYSC